MLKYSLFVLSLFVITIFANEVNIKQCAACHGIDWERKAMGKSKVVADMNETAIVAALKGYKDDTYGGPMKGIMKGQVARFSDDDIIIIAKEIKQ